MEEKLMFTETSQLYCVLFYVSMGLEEISMRFSLYLRIQPTRCSEATELGSSLNAIICLFGDEPGPFLSSVSSMKWGR